MRKIKWENIAFIIVIILDTIAVIKHGISIFTPSEIIIYITMAIVLRYIIKDLRIN